MARAAHEPADIDTIEASGGSTHDDPELAPHLTIACHPDLARIGERVRLAERDDAEISRLRPLFRPVGKRGERSLDDPYVSRTPARVSPRWPDGVAIIPPHSGGLVVDGEPIAGEIVLPFARVRAGVTLELARRVVLLLHMARPDAEADGFGLVGASDATALLRQRIRQVADTEVPVLLRGETGVGKEHVARAIHDVSPRAGGPFVAVNMAAIAPSTAASELFGHVRGSFTGAHERHTGLFERAAGGTLFLDEIGDAPAEVQTMLLRALETRSILPLGASSERRVDVRVVAATDVDLEAAGREGSFRTALLHRLAGFEIEVPPLRARRDDVARLFVHFLRCELEAIGEHHRTAAPARGELPLVPARLVAELVRYRWPGNVRQLRNVVRQLVIGSRGARRLQRAAIAHVLRPRDASRDGAPAPAQPARPADLGEEAIAAALRANGWAPGRAASALGVPKSTLYEIIGKSDRLRLAKDLDRDEIEACRREHGDDLDALADALCVSRRGLTLRMKALGLA